jgi:hypothetical protein
LEDLPVQITHYGKVVATIHAVIEEHAVEKPVRAIPITPKTIPKIKPIVTTEVKLDDGSVAEFTYPGPEMPKIKKKIKPTPKTESSGFYEKKVGDLCPCGIPKNLCKKHMFSK